jgi:hypothetical protein
MIQVRPKTNYTQHLVKRTELADDDILDELYPLGIMVSYLKDGLWFVTNSVQEEYLDGAYPYLLITHEPGKIAHILALTKQQATDEFERMR